MPRPSKRSLALRFRLAYVALALLLVGAAVSFALLLSGKGRAAAPQHATQQPVRCAFANLNPQDALVRAFWCLHPSALAWRARVQSQSTGRFLVALEYVPGPHRALVELRQLADRRWRVASWVEKG